MIQKMSLQTSNKIVLRFKKNNTLEDIDYIYLSF